MISLIVASLAALAYVGAVPSGHHLQHIPVPGYHPKLQLLGQHVDLHEIPTKIIRITKTVAIKVPVPYPVKVPHNIPYPVHVSKPYPVPVPQIIKVPQPVAVPVPSSGSSAWPGAAHDQGANQYQSPITSYGTQAGHDSVAYSGAGNGYENHYPESSDGSHGYVNSEQYGESQQVSNPVAYQDSPTSAYQGHDASSYQLGSGQSYGGAQGHLSHQDVGQDSYQIKAEPSHHDGGYPSEHGSYQESGHSYQMAAPQQGMQAYEHGSYSQ